MNQPMIESVSVDGRDIQKLIFDKLGPALDGEKMAHSILAMLTFTVLLLKPDIELEEVQKIVMSTSEFLVMSLAPMGEAN